MTFFEGFALETREAMASISGCAAPVPAALLLLHGNPQTTPCGIAWRPRWHVISR
jgi:hypothetical protein